MIKFFRHIRYTLMETGKTGKPTKKAGTYLKYAIGEIILVMVGILLALQVNNWNENRKSKEYERKILNEVVEDLKLDTTLIQVQFGRIKHFENSVDMILKQPTILNNKNNGYSLFGGVYFIQNTKALETMKSGGTQIHFNDKLRQQINAHYHNAQFYLDLLSMEDKNFFELRGIPLQKKLFKIIDNSNANNFNVSVVPIDYEATIDSQEFKDYLLLRKSRTVRWSWAYNKIYESTIECLDAIEAYLNNSE